MDKERSGDCIMTDKEEIVKTDSFQTLLEHQLKINEELVHERKQDKETIKYLEAALDRARQGCE